MSDKLKEIVFYSNVNMGDVHLCRSYVSALHRCFPDVPKWTFSHNQHPTILKDVHINTGIEYDGQLWQHCPRDQDIFTDNTGRIFLNTWIGAGGRTTGVNYQTLQELFEFYHAKLSTVVPPKHVFPTIIPHIDFRYFETAGIDQWLATHDASRVRVFVANNEIRSGQFYNFNMNDMIFGLAESFPEADFYLSNVNEPKLSKDNIFYTSDIIASTTGFDANEQAYMSTKCQIIFGRGSGPFSFCEVAENFTKRWVSMTFLRLGNDAFNGLHKFEQADPSKFHHIEQMHEIYGKLGELINEIRSEE